MTEVRGQKIAELARSYAGVPWRHQGRSRMGLDCVGLVYRVWCDLGLDPSVDGTGYGHVSDGKWLRETVDRLLMRVHEPVPGGVALMAQRGLHPLHLGIVTEVRGQRVEIRRIVHANARARKVIEQVFTAALGLRPVAYYQYPEVGSQRSEMRGQMTEEKGQRLEEKVSEVQRAPSDLCPLTSDI